MAPFKLGINMAGAISAGAYTAGVLDFLTEALDAWYQAKTQKEFVPLHDISIEVFTGASAGGMCAAISAILLQDDFDHISDTSRTGTNNRFYESWVNMIDMQALLKTDDLKEPSSTVVSLLDSSIIDTIAGYALTRGKPLDIPRRYVSPNLALFLSLTNLRGVPYSLNGVAPASVEQTTFFYGDRIRFEINDDRTVQDPAPNANVIDLTKPNTESAWNILRTSAIATGAFPVFLKPRVLLRGKSDYTPPLWESMSSAAQSTPPPLSPTFPVGLADPFETLNVDGGVTNNDPYNYAHDYLASLAPSISGADLPSEAHRVDRAVLSIAPFPTTDVYSAKYDTGSNSSVLRALPRLFSALISQSRFFGESLSKVMAGTSFSNFIVAPSDDQLVQKDVTGRLGGKSLPPALQCASLGAFGGFFERGFRAHDYALGRRNCQKFLRDHFILPADNPIIRAGLPNDQAAREQLIQQFRRPAPSGQPEADWLPIIPLCAVNVLTPMSSVPRVQMDRKKLNLIVRLILRRFRAVVTALLDPIPSWPLRIFLKIGQPIIAFLTRKPLTTALIKQLGDSYRP
jgi:predicted acylesterase/phospholipase RssA